MSIRISNTIDFISLDKDEKIVILTVADEMDWHSDNNHLILLQEKLNYYLSFLESGEVYESYPKSVNKKFRIQVMFKYEPNPEGIEFLGKVEQALVNAGFEFIYSLL